MEYQQGQGPVKVFKVSQCHGKTRIRRPNSNYKSNHKITSFTHIKMLSQIFNEQPQCQKGCLLGLFSFITEQCVFR